MKESTSNNNNNNNHQSLPNVRDLVHGILVCMCLDLKAGTLEGGEVICNEARHIVKALAQALSEIEAQRADIDTCLKDEELHFSVVSDLLSYSTFNGVSDLEALICVHSLAGVFFDLITFYSLSEDTSGRA